LPGQDAIQIDAWIETIEELITTNGFSVYRRYFHTSGTETIEALIGSGTAFSWANPRFISGFDYGCSGVARPENRPVFDRYLTSIRTRASF
jgi:hypothetical protein